jgi:hypothetical protein
LPGLKVFKVSRVRRGQRETPVTTRLYQALKVRPGLLVLMARTEIRVFKGYRASQGAPLPLSDVRLMVPEQ